MVELLPLAILSIIGAFLLFDKALDLPSVVVTLTISYLILTTRNFEWFAILFAFFAFAYLSTKVHSLLKPKEAHEQRTTDNIISNSLVAFMSALFGFPYVYLGSISAGLADTMSSEIGMLSKSRPVLITNPRKKVPAGTNGGITLFGTFAAFMGSVIIASLAYYFAPGFFSVIGAETNPIKMFFAVAIAGILGSFTDSIFGALFENKKIVSNGAVNFIATVSGGIIAFLIMYLL